jgi:hypothetical protein
MPRLSEFMDKHPTSGLLKGLKSELKKMMVD